MDATEIAYFAPADDGEELVPLDLARSTWSPEQAHGVAVSGALARTAEQAIRRLGRDDIRPTRWSLDLFRPVRMQPCELTSTVVRESRRLCLVDVVLSQDGEPHARASALFLKATESAPAPVWSPDGPRPMPPPVELAPPTDVPHVPFFSSEHDWSQDFFDHQNAGPHRQWTTQPHIVRGEERSPFQSVAAAADGVNLVTNWGAGGIDYINADVTLTLSRLPAGHSIGLAATDRLERDGIAVGTALLFDREGPVGTAVVTAMANTRRSIDFSSVSYDDRGLRTDAGA